MPWPANVDDTSTIPGENSSFDYPHGHYELLFLTAADRVSLLQQRHQRVRGGDVRTR